jgi:hypothetical protein
MCIASSSAMENQQAQALRPTLTSSVRSLLKPKKPMDNTGTNPSLLTLPPELRLQIFSLVLEDWKPFNISNISKRYPRYNDEKTRSKDYASLVATCRQLHSEVLPHFWSNTRILMPYLTYGNPPPLDTLPYRLMRRVNLINLTSHGVLLSCSLRRTIDSDIRSDNPTLQIEVEAWKRHEGSHRLSNFLWPDAEGYDKEGVPARLKGFRDRALEERIRRALCKVRAYIASTGFSEEGLEDLAAILRNIGSRYWQA